jgi:DNA-binding NarL/FixJ family response regulator
VFNTQLKFRLKMKSPKIKIIIADDHFVCRDGLISILSEEKYEIIGQANNGSALVEIVKFKQPDVVFLDIQMPILDGIESTKVIQKCFPQIKIIVLTMYEQESSILEMFAAGANAYLLKSADKKEIIDSIDVVLNNELYFSKEINKKTLAKLKTIFKDNRKIRNIANLTDTEIQIIKLICEEFTSEEIGKFLFLSKRTIDGARLRIQNKIDVLSTAGIVKFAIENGIYRSIK